VQLNKELMTIVERKFKDSFQGRSAHSRIREFANSKRNPAHCIAISAKIMKMNIASRFDTLVDINGIPQFIYNVLYAHEPLVSFR